MEEFNVRITAVQAELKDEMVSGKLGKTVARCEKEKSSFEAAMERIKKLSEDIQEFVQKFDSIKDEIEISNKKFENFKMEIETKKSQIQLLETQIQNIMLMGQLRDKTREDIQNERLMITKQVDTLNNLK